MDSARLFVTMYIMVDLFSIYRVYFVAAALGAHSNAPENGFRQKDVRFLLGLFLNWMDATTKGVDETIHNTQISRYLEGLVKSGHASRVGKQRAPSYQLTRTGLLELVSQLTHVPVGSPIEQFFFVYFFARTYGERLKELVAQKENRLPRSFQVELEALLDHRELLEQQIRATQLEIKKLESRIQDTKGAHALAMKLSAQGAKVDELIAAVESRYPYDLNSQKPMSELFREVPPPLRQWELTVGNLHRADFLWSSMKEYLQDYVKTLQRLAKSGDEGGRLTL